MPDSRPKPAELNFSSSVGFFCFWEIWYYFRNPPPHSTYEYTVIMEKNNKKANEVQVDEILSWASRFDDASYEAKHLVIAQLVDRIEIRKNDGYDITIHWRMTAEQFLERKKEESA